MTLLIATDLSAAARRAADVAVELARAWGRTCVVLHVAERDTDLRALEREIERLSEAVNVELALRHGAVAAVIEGVADELAARCVVLGATPGAGLGHVTASLVARLGTDVLVVHDAECLLRFAAGGAAALRLVLPQGTARHLLAGAALAGLAQLGPLDGVLVPASGGAGRLDDALLDAARDTRCDLLVCPARHRAERGFGVESSLALALARRARTNLLVTAPR